MGAFASCVGRNKPAAARDNHQYYDSRQQYQQPRAAESRRGESARRRPSHSGRMHAIQEDDDARSMRSYEKPSRNSSSSRRHRDSGLRKSTNSSSGSVRSVQSRGNRHSSSNGHGRLFSSEPSPARPQRKIVDRTEFSHSAAGRGHNRKRSTRRDDASTISASLAETYKGYITNNDKDEDYLDEQSAIRRSLKEMKQPSGYGTRHQQQQQSGRQPRSLDQHVVPNKTNSRGENATQASERTELENWIEGGKGRGKKKEAGNEFDNVTTISKASKNPYRVLGISQSASPREIYKSYKKKMVETEQTGGGEKAFADVGNAYRRVKADMQRQQERQQGQQQARNRGSERSGRRSRRRKSRRSETDMNDEEESAATRREAIESRLKDHGELVKGLFAADSKERAGHRDSSSVSAGGQVTTLSDSVQCQAQALSEMNIVPVEGGATNINEKKKTITNSCFYLSLAASYLSGAGAFGDDPTAPYYYKTLDNASTMTTVEMEIAALPKREKQVTMKLALQLKRAIEAAVLLVHPEWAASGMVGEEVQAFSDFLVYALDSDSVLGHLAIAVFDEASGFVDIYRGRHYGKTYPPTKVKTRRKSGGRSRDSYRVKCRYVECDDETRRANTLTLRYIPGHYQPLLPELTKIHNERKRGETIGFTKRPMLEELLSTLEKYNVLHVVTDGRA